MASTPQHKASDSLARAVARLPWWAWVALAIASYFALHAFTQRTSVIVTDTSQLGAALPGLVLCGLAEDLQVIAPQLLCLVAAPFVRRWFAETLESADQPLQSDPVEGISAAEFELLTVDAWHSPPAGCGEAIPLPTPGA
jgi:restriction system protein